MMKNSDPPENLSPEETARRKKAEDRFNQLRSYSKDSDARRKVIAEEVDKYSYTQPMSSTPLKTQYSAINQMKNVAEEESEALEERASRSEKQAWKEWQTESDRRASMKRKK